MHTTPGSDGDSDDDDGETEPDVGVVDGGNTVKMTKAQIKAERGKRWLKQGGGAGGDAGGAGASGDGVAEGDSAGNTAEGATASKGKNKRGRKEKHKTKKSKRNTMQVQELLVCEHFFIYVSCVSRFFFCFGMMTSFGHSCAFKSVYGMRVLARTKYLFHVFQYQGGHRPRSIRVRKRTSALRNKENVCGEGAKNDRSERTGMSVTRV